MNDATNKATETTTVKITARERVMLAIVDNAREDGNRAVECASAEDKKAVRSLEGKGLVSVEKTAQKCAGLPVWFVRRAA